MTLPKQSTCLIFVNFTQIKSHFYPNDAGWSGWVYNLIDLSLMSKEAPKRKTRPKSPAPKIKQTKASAKLTVFFKKKEVSQSHCKSPSESKAKKTT